jgi:hypothetical protein
MPNPLTGDFDAVVQVSVPTLNRLLTSMHQNDGNDAGLPTLPHRAVVSIGDKPLGGSLAGIKGSARVQIGVPTVALVANEPRSVDVSCWIRARYHADPKTVSLPEFIHGRISARFDVTDAKVPFFDVSFGILATASPEDAHITFTDSGLNSVDSQKVTLLIRDFLRTRAVALLSLFPDIPSGAFDFRALTDGQGRQAVALPIMLAGTAPASGNLGQVFLDGTDCAIAVSKEAILTLLQPYIIQFNQDPKPNEPVLWATYKVSMTAALTWIGALTLTISGTAKTSAVGFPNATFELRQSFTFPFTASAQSIAITPSGEPSVEKLTFSGGADPAAWLSSWVLNNVEAAKKQIKNGMIDRFKTERDKALEVANEEINEKLAPRREQLRDLLRKIDDLAEVTLTSAPPSDHGVLLTGKISLSQRKQPHVEFSELNDGSGYTAFDSWVPGGRITAFRWTWWHRKDYVPGQLWIPVHDPPPLEDRYVLQEGLLFGVAPTGPSGEPPKSQAEFEASLDYMLAPGPWTGIWFPPEGQLCLSIRVERVDPDTGQMVLWGWSSEAVLKPHIACKQGTAVIPADITLYYPPKEMPGPCPGWNVLVFVIQSAERELVSEVLLQAIRQAARLDAPTMLLFALNIGSRGPSPALAARARELRQKSPQVGVALADRNESWLKDLGLPEDGSQALRLLDPAGRLTWRHDGGADAATIAAALREHLVAAPPPRGGVVQARLRPGERPPDFSFEVAPRNRIALRHLRGRRLAVIFVSEGHAALEAMLRRLSAHAPETDEPRMVVIVQDGESSTTAAAAPGGLRFDWIAVPDPERAIARSYGISMRPTAVLVDWDGRVSSVQTMSTAPTTLRRASAGHGAERG